MVCFWQQGLAAISSAYAERIALVIGNDLVCRTCRADQQLNKAVNDARTMGDSLEAIGFSVIRGENLDRQAMIDRIFAFTQRIKPGDTALLFYAGHGVAIGGGNYLLPADVRAANPGEEARVRAMAIGEADIIADIQDRKAKVAVLMLDACRDNPFKQPGLTRSAGAAKGLSRSAEAEGVFAIYSAGFGQTALDTLGEQRRVAEFGLHPRDGAGAAAQGRASRRSRHRRPPGGLQRWPRRSIIQQNPAYYDQTRGGRIYLVPGDGGNDSSGGQERTGAAGDDGGAAGAGDCAGRSQGAPSAASGWCRKTEAGAVSGHGAVPATPSMPSAVTTWIPRAARSPATRSISRRPKWKSAMAAFSSGANSRMSPAFMRDSLPSMV